MIANRISETDHTAKFEEDLALKEWTPICYQLISVFSKKEIKSIRTKFKELNALLERKLRYASKIKQNPTTSEMIYDYPAGTIALPKQSCIWSIFKEGNQVLFLVH